ncbi:MAG: hypothetical protein BWY47_01626 [Bacteroidetes bacterium ADurb.Bin302]|nr:MAG: hypothetical protein BWY47_01626 [Bacteroidetes bacterium ADurb.Bin302]
MYISPLLENFFMYNSAGSFVFDMVSNNADKAFISITFCSKSGISTLVPSASFLRLRKRGVADNLIRVESSNTPNFGVDPNTESKLNFIDKFGIKP